LRAGNRLFDWRVARDAKTAIRQIARLKRANPGRPFCGILLIEHIGDIIACEPIIEQLKTSYPGAFVVWVVSPRYADLLASHPKLDAMVFVRSLLSIERIVLSSVFDVAIDLHINGKATEIPNRPYRKTSGDPTVDVETYVRRGSLLQSFAESAGLTLRPSAPTMYVPTTAVAEVDQLSLPDHFVVVHAASNYAPKDWPSVKWRELVQHILERYETTVVEIGLGSKIELDHPRFINLCGKLSLMGTAELIRRADFFVGIDSGPAHMANAWRRPALLLFGRYLGSDSFNPFSGYYRDEEPIAILRYRGPLREQSAGVVIDALEASPLWKRTHAHLRRRDFLNTSLISQ
jgi:heptosyltransferase-3